MLSRDEERQCLLEHARQAVLAVALLATLRPLSGVDHGYHLVLDQLVKGLFPAPRDDSAGRNRSSSDQQNPLDNRRVSDPQSSGGFSSQR